MEVKEAAVSSQPAPVSRSFSHDVDQAHEFLTQHADPEAVRRVSMYRLMNKIDWHLAPLLFFSYFFQALDKQALSYAAVMGLPKDLNLKGGDFSNAATALFVALLVAQIPTAYAINKLPAAKWLAANSVLWGIATGATAAVRNNAGLLAVRILMGLFEAAVLPCVTIICSQYYRKDKSGFRFTLWGAAIGCSFVFGAILSFAFQHVHSASLASWRILFIVLGIISAVFGLALFWLLPDTPMQARYLSDCEKIALLQHVSVNKTGVRSTSFKAQHLLELIRDPQIWMLTTLTILITMTTGFTLSYTALVIAGFGFAPPLAALLAAPGGLITLISAWVAGLLLSTRLPRALVVAGIGLIVVIGSCLLAFADVANRAALLAGIYLINCGPTLYAVMYQWASANVAGQTKRAATMALITAAFAAGALIAPQTFRDGEAPKFMSAKITLVATQIASVVLAGLLGLYYHLSNRRRDAQYGKSELFESEGADATQSQTWENLTDKERERTFRYMP